MRDKEGLIRWRGVCEKCGSIIVSQFADISRLTGQVVAMRRCCCEEHTATMKPVVLHFGDWLEIDTSEEK
jgi:hypothetical protein